VIQKDAGFTKIQNLGMIRKKKPPTSGTTAGRGEMDRIFRCRTVATGGIFLGPKWAEPIYKKYSRFFHLYEKEMFFKILRYLNRGEG
jgi:hypothetical protein